MKYIFIPILLFFSLKSWAIDDLKAPVGLSWGLTEKELVRKFSAVKTEEHSDLELYKISNPPIKLDDIDSVYGAIDKKYGLVRVVLIKEFERDEYGFDGVELYRKYKKVLSDKYGEPESYEYIGRKVYSAKDEFYECLKYKGCGGYSSFFLPKSNSGLYMMLVGYGRGSGVLEIYYESSDLKHVEDEKDKLSIKQANDGL